jgi:threonine dehydratase
LTLPTIEDALSAREGLRGRVTRTPVLRAERLDDLAGRPIHAKMESLQQTGSFKVRGATNRLRTLDAAAVQGGLITVSAGNAALGAAHAARALGAPLTVVMPANAVPEKLAAVRAYGGHVVSDGITSAAVAFDRAHAIAAENGLTFVHPFDDPMVIAGAATATMELLEDVPDLRRVYVPCSGGGLLAGAVMAAAAMSHTVEVIGVQPTGAAGFVKSLAAGKPVETGRVSTIADGLTAPRPGAIPFQVVRRANVRVVTVSDHDILASMRELILALRAVVEPSAAASFAGLLAERDSLPDGDVAVLITGSNVSWSLVAEIVGGR